MTRAYTYTFNPNGTPYTFTSFKKKVVVRPQMRSTYSHETNKKGTTK